MLYKFLLSVKVTVLLLLLALILAIIFMFNPFNKSSKYEIVETQEFTCSGLEGFAFEYPLFKDWDVQSTSKKHSTDQFCTIVFNKTNSSGDPVKFSVHKINRPGYPAPGSPTLEYPPKLTLINPQNIPYNGDVINSYAGKPITEAKNSVKFYADEFAVEITLEGIDSVLGNSFSREQFFNEVIESFRTTSN